jgi:cytochrome P450
MGCADPGEFTARPEDTEIRGCFILKGDTVMTIQASANRDEDVFEDGEHYDALREPNPH